jgi:hypothetical protein
MEYYGITTKYSIAIRFRAVLLSQTQDGLVHSLSEENTTLRPDINR